MCRRRQRRRPAHLCVARAGRRAASRGRGVPGSRQCAAPCIASPGGCTRRCGQRRRARQHRPLTEEPLPPGRLAGVQTPLWPCWGLPRFVAERWPPKRHACTSNNLLGSALPKPHACCGMGSERLTASSADCREAGRKGERAGGRLPRRASKAAASAGNLSLLPSIQHISSAPGTCPHLYGPRQCFCLSTARQK